MKTDDQLFRLADAKLIDQVYKVPSLDNVNINIFSNERLDMYGETDDTTTELSLDKKSKLLAMLEQYVSTFIQRCQMYACLPGNNDPVMIDNPRDMIRLIRIIFDKRYTPVINQLIGTELGGIRWISVVASRYLSDVSETHEWYNNILTARKYEDLDPEIFFHINDTMPKLMNSMTDDKWAQYLFKGVYFDPIALNLVQLRLRTSIAAVLEHLASLLRIHISQKLNDYQRLIKLGLTHTKSPNQERTSESIIVSGKLIYRYGRIFDLLQKTSHGYALRKVFTEYAEEALSNSMNYLCRVALQDPSGGLKIPLLSDLMKWYLTSCAISTPFIFENLQITQGRLQDTVEEQNINGNQRMKPNMMAHAKTNDELQNLMYKFFIDGDQLDQFVSLRSYMKDLLNSVDFDRQATMPDINRYFYLSEGLKRTILNSDSTFNNLMPVFVDGGLKTVQRHTLIKYLSDACKYLASEMPDTERHDEPLGYDRKVPARLSRYSSYVMGASPLFWITMFEERIFKNSGFVPNSNIETIQDYINNADAIHTCIEMMRHNAGFSLDELVYFYEYITEVDDKNSLDSTFNFGAPMGRTVKPTERASSDMYIFDDVPHSQLCDDLLFANRIFPIIYKFQRRTRKREVKVQEKFELVTLKKYVNDRIWKNEDIVEDSGYMVRRMNDAVMFGSYVDNLQWLPIFVAEITRNQTVKKYDSKTLSYKYKNTLFDNDVLADHVLSLCMFTENVDPAKIKDMESIINRRFVELLTTFKDKGFYYTDDLGVVSYKTRDDISSLKKNFFLGSIDEMGSNGLLKLSKITTRHKLDHVRLIKKLRLKLHYVAFYDMRSPIFMVKELESMISGGLVKDNDYTNKSNLDTYILSNSIEFEFNRDLFISTPLVNKTYLTAILGNGAINTMIWGDSPKENPTLLQIPTSMIAPVSLERPLNVRTTYERYFNNTEIVNVTRDVEGLNIAAYTLAEVIKMTKGVESPQYHLFNFVSVWSLAFLDRYSSTDRLDQIRHQVPITVGNFEGSSIRKRVTDLCAEIKLKIGLVLKHFKMKLDALTTADVSKCEPLLDTLFVPTLFTSKGVKKLSTYDARNKYLDRTLSESFITNKGRVPVPRTSTEKIYLALPKFIVEELDRDNRIFTRDGSSINFMNAYTLIRNVLTYDTLSARETYKAFAYIKPTQSLMDDVNVTKPLDVASDEFKSLFTTQYERDLLMILSYMPIDLMMYTQSIRPSNSVISFRDTVLEHASILTPQEFSSKSSFDLFLMVNK